MLHIRSQTIIENIFSSDQIFVSLFLSDFMKTRLKSQKIYELYSNENNKEISIIDYIRKKTYRNKRRDIKSGNISIFEKKNINLQFWDIISVNLEPIKISD